MKKVFFFFAEMTLLLTMVCANNAKRLPKAALETAKEIVPKTAKYKSFTLDDGQYEIYFLDSDKTKYEVEVDSLTNEVRKMEVDRIKHSESKTVTLTEEDVQSLIEKKFPGAGNILIKLDHENASLYKYEVEFSTDSFKAEIDINPETGDFSDEEYDFF